MARCIICGVDDSKITAEAVLVARCLSERLGCRLILVNVGRVPIAPGASAVPHAHDELRKGTLEEARRLLERACADHDLGKAVERRAVLGDPVERLSVLAKEEGAELLVVGTRGHGKLRSALVGSVSRALRARAPCPVVVVPRGIAVPRFVRREPPVRGEQLGGAPTPRPLTVPWKGGALGVRPRTSSR
jgi:nucleotide-binding universal stress UspA family protein